MSASSAIFVLKENWYLVSLDQFSYFERLCKLDSKPRCQYPRPRHSSGQSFSSFGNVLIRELPNHGANLGSLDARLVFLKFMHDMYPRVESGQPYYVTKTYWYKNVTNPFINRRWGGPFAGKEKRVFNICLHGLNNDRAVRSISGASGTFHVELQKYFTLASVARKEIMVRSRKANFVKATV